MCGFQGEHIKKWNLDPSYIDIICHLQRNAAFEMKKEKNAYCEEKTLFWENKDETWLQSKVLRERAHNT